jgi:tRNA(Ile)-lysidine synthase
VGFVTKPATLMQDALYQRVLRTIERHNMFGPGDRMGVAVSGGADSVALLRLLLKMRVNLGISLTVLHFNHLLRGAESDEDERFVASLAAELGLEYASGVGDVAGTARERRWNLEDAARRMRYEFIRSTVKRKRWACCAVAHTADDQAETVMARLVRGTGPAGLAGIYPVKGTVVRPLMDVRRAELREYLVSVGQTWREDRSNEDVSRLRARLRHRVLPAIESELRRQVVPNLCKIAEFARDDEIFWKELVRERIAALRQRRESDVGIRSSDLLAPLGWMDKGTSASSAALSRRLVRGLLQEVRGHFRGITAQHVEQVLRLAGTNGSGRRAELPGAIVERSFGWLWFSSAPAHNDRRCKGKSDLFERAVQLGGSGEETVVAVPEIGKRFSLKVIDWTRRERETTVQGVLDRDLLRSPLVLRSWRPGDSYQPEGRRRALKLKRLLRETRVAFGYRASWPVMTSAGSLVWARGCPVASEYVPGESTGTALLIAEEEI